MDCRLEFQPTDDSVEVAVDFLKECGSILQDLCPKGLHGIFERFHVILHEGEIDKRVPFLIEGLSAIRKAKFQGHPAVRPELDIVEPEDQLTHELSFEDEYCLVRTLLKSCPKLEDLCLILDLTGGDLLEIFAPNLKSLSIDNLVITPSNDVVIDAPKLTKLKICDRCSYFSFRTIPTLLVEASINFRSYDDSECDILYLYVEDRDWTEEGYALAISKFFRGMSSVRSFKLQCFANMHIFLGSSDDGDMAVFHNLTFFKAKLDNDVGWEDSLCSLHCFPNLEHLELNLDEFYFCDPLRCFAPIVLPDCLLTKLKRVTLKKIKGTGVEIKLIELILNHADVLEELFLYAPTGPCMEYEVTQLWKEYKFCEALFNLSRSFITCKIVFSGVYINASSNAFEKGLIGCQIRFSEDLAGIDID